jgi:hypothetical protein
MISFNDDLVVKGVEISVVFMHTDKVLLNSCITPFSQKHTVVAADIRLRLLSRSWVEVILQFP